MWDIVDLLESQLQIFYIIASFRVNPLAQCFFKDYLKHKTINKTICRMPWENSHELCTH